MTAFEQTIETISSDMRLGALGQGQSVALQPLPPNNAVPRGALLGMFDGKGGGCIMILSEKGLLRLHDGLGKLLGKEGA